MSKKPRKAPTSGPTPKEIVAAWHEKLVSELDPWFIKESKDVKTLKSKLETNIADIVNNGAVFTTVDMKNSLKVAKDAARICKILQPDPHPKEVSFDNLQRVLKVCAKGHFVCRGPGGGGGWCDVT